MGSPNLLHPFCRLRCYTDIKAGWHTDSQKLYKVGTRFTEVKTDSRKLNKVLRKSKRTLRSSTSRHTLCGSQNKLPELRLLRKLQKVTTRFPDAKMDSQKLIVLRMSKPDSTHAEQTRRSSTSFQHALWRRKWNR